MYGEGGTKRVALLVVIPNGVATFNRPDRPAVGTVIPRLDVTADVTVAGEVFTVTVLLAGVVWKFVPFIVTAVPAAALAGEKLVIVGADGGLPTVNAAPLADPPGLVTASPPVVAPVGTTAVNCVDVADVAVVPVPLNETVLFAAIGLKPVPETVTVVPTGPLRGVKLTMDTSVEA